MLTWSGRDSAVSRIPRWDGCWRWTADDEWHCPRRPECSDDPDIHWLNTDLQLLYPPNSSTLPQCSPHSYRTPHQRIHRSVGSSTVPLYRTCCATSFTLAMLVPYRLFWNCPASMNRLLRTSTSICSWIINQWSIDIPDYGRLRYPYRTLDTKW